MDKNMELNSLVAEYCEQRKQGVSRNKIKSFGKIYKICSDRTGFYKSNKNYKEAYDYSFSEAIINALDNYAPEKNSNFFYYFRLVLENEMKKELKNYNKIWSQKNINNIHLDNSEINYQDLIVGGDVRDEVNDYVGLLDFAIDIVKVQQKNLKTSPKICWATYFFTETVAFLVSTYKTCYDHVNSQSTRYLSVISMEFINSFVINKCHTIEDISKNANTSKLKPQKAFSDKGIDKPCGYALILAVYAKFTGKSEEAVCMQKKKYNKYVKESFDLEF